MDGKLIQLLELGRVSYAEGLAVQHRVVEARKQGRILPLPEIERRVIPTMRGAQYLGPEVDFDTGVYTLKFLRNGTVIWVQVDGRSGQVIGRTGY